MVKKQKAKDIILTLIFAIFLSPLAISYFYLGKTKRALIWLGVAWGSLILMEITNEEWVFMITYIGFFYTIYDSFKIAKSTNFEDEMLEKKKDIENKKIMKLIIEKFNKRYLTPEQKDENISQLTNLINHKLNKYYTDENVKVFMIYFEKEHYIELFDKEISKLKDKSQNNIAKVFIKLAPETYFEDETDFQSFLLFEGLCEYLNRKKIDYNITKLKRLIQEEYKLLKAKQFEEKISRNPDKRISIEEIEHLDGFEFEELLGKLFREAGYKVKVTKKSGDQGADLVIEKNGVCTAIQAKKYAGNVGNTAVQEVVAAMKYYDCDKSMVITTGLFTKGAFELASRNGVQLVDKKGLDKFFDEIL
jgi:HJR/Mrr/RecB family endonuclease